MARNNSFPEKLITNLKTQMQQKIHQKQDKDENKKWATFTYHSPQIRQLTILFKHTNINIGFKSTSTIQYCTKPKAPDKNQEYNMSGIYKLTCKMSYIGQTSRNLEQRFREHIRYIRNNNPQSAYAQHILQNRHEYGSITDTMTLL
jgi:hypothetical protein